MFKENIEFCALWTMVNEYGHAEKPLSCLKKKKSCDDDFLEEASKFPDAEGENVHLFLSSFFKLTKGAVLIKKIFSRKIDGNTFAFIVYRFE